jgi:protoporphyrinogen oxidase
MHIAILGAGFSGLSAAYRLLKKGHQITIFEKESSPGGLAIGFKNPKWDWTLEKAYHHFFTNDYSILNLARELNHKVITVKPSTDILVYGRRVPLDTPLSLITFPALSFIDRLRLGSMLLYLKLCGNQKNFTTTPALGWIRKTMGENVSKLIWEPLLEGKFGKYKNQIALSWFWARIKKRTPSLAYPQGGFQAFADNISYEIKKMGGKIYLNTEVIELRNINKNIALKLKTKNGSPTKSRFDKVIVTLPSPIFTKIAPDLPYDYSKRINSIPHLHAQVLILILKEPFMDRTYWLNITDRKFPFLVLAEHTNFMSPSHYGNQHILYIGNYLPGNHPYLKMNDVELLRKFMPFLEKINPNLKSIIINHHSFIGPFAQPVVTTDYYKKIPEFKTPLKNIYLANLDMVYPWDRGTNYAVELGEKAAEIVMDDK